MNPNKKGTIPTLLAFLVLVSTLLAPLVTAVLSIVVLTVLGIYKTLSREK